MKLKILSFFILINLFFNSFAKSFSDAVDDATKENNSSSSSSSSKSSSSSSSSKSANSLSDSSSDSDFCSEFIFAVLKGCITGIFELWFYTNTNESFASYPYQYQNSFGYSYNKNFYTDSENEALSNLNLRPYRFSFDTSAFYMNELGWGNESKFEGQFWFIGPYFENQIFSEKISEYSENYQGNVKLGGQFFLLQSNPLKISFLLQWSHWYGNNINPVLNKGMTFGFDFHSYPYKPIELQWKTTWSHFDENVGIYESNLLLGFLINRFEIFGSWRYMEVYNYKSDKTTGKWNGASLGTKIYF